MLRSLPEFLSRVFKNWWAVLGIINGIVSFTGRLRDFGPATPFIRPLFITAAIVCLGRSLLRVYHEQKTEVEALKSSKSEYAALITILAQKLRGEVEHNLEHLRSGPEMLHTEAWEAFTPEHLALLPSYINDSASDFYRDLRSLKAILLRPTYRPWTKAMKDSPFEKRKRAEKDLPAKGRVLLSLLENVLTQKNMSSE